MPKQTFLLILTLSVIAGLLISISFALSFQKNQSKEVVKVLPSPTPDPAQVMLEISTPKLISTNSATQYFAEILINSNNLINTNYIQLELQYDPSAISYNNITPGNFFDNPKTVLKKIDIENGRITYALSDIEKIVEQGVIATLSFTKKSTRSADLTKIEILPKSKITSPNFPQSVLKSAIGIEF